MRDYLFFNEMLTPKFITVIYWILLVAYTLFGLLFMVGGMLAGNGVLGFLMSLFGGILMILLGWMGARIMCEFIIVIFKIHENIKKLADRS